MSQEGQLLEHILSTRGSGGLGRALRALKRVRHERGEPLRFVCSWKNTSSEYEHEALLIIDPRSPPPLFFTFAFSFGVRLLRLSAAPLSASEIGLCFHVCCYGEISLVMCALSHGGVGFLVKESCAEYLFFIYVLIFASIRPWKWLRSGSR